MNILFHLGHPAHFHLFKHTIQMLEGNGDNISIVIKRKDILEELLVEAGLRYHNILPKGRKNSTLGIAIGQFKQDAAIFKFARANKIECMIGTSASIAHVGKLMGITSIVVNEDDADVVPYFSKLSYPFADIILSPIGCRNGKWEYKTIHYNSYHELSYLHPRNFKLDVSIKEKYIPGNKPYFILRFSGLDAHHDKGIEGINSTLSSSIINLLGSYGTVIINSERKLEKEFEKYRLNINPLDMHHLLAGAHIFIGDSQTMAAEAGVLGIPFLRFNDFVGKISYLDELENKYKLGFGFSTDSSGLLFQKLKELLSNPDLKNIWAEKREIMLKDKIDFSDYMIKFITHIKNSKPDKITVPEFIYS